MPDESLRIDYTLVEQSGWVSRATAFHVLSQSDYGLLRCYMALLQLPGTTADFRTDVPPFLAAVARAIGVPTFRKAQTKQMPRPDQWEDLKSSPLAVLMVGNDAPPIWLESLAAHRDIGVLTSSERLYKSLRTMARVHAGLLQGNADLRESYRVLGTLLQVATDGRFGAEASFVCRELAGRDIFATRMRLDFIPAFPLPQPEQGRPAAYLLNRLSNNVDEPGLSPDRNSSGVTVVPSMFDWCLRACAALARFEGNETSATLNISADELSHYRDALTRTDTTPKERFGQLLKLGSHLAGGKPLQRPFFIIPVPRHDLVQGKGPASVTLDPQTKESSRSAVRAVKDFTNNPQQPQKTPEEASAYQEAWWTLQSEQRLIACQATWLAARAHTTPIQLGPRPALLYNTLNDLSAALATNSRKTATLFRNAEERLAEALPDGMLEHLDQGNSPVTFFSDIPFEWTRVGDWPLCLTRPVSRIPISNSHWDVLSAALERPATIDMKLPERVLVISVIGARDPIRAYSDQFAAISNELAQRYTYAAPRNAQEFIDVLTHTPADIVVLDAHGGYDPTNDQLFIEIAGDPVPLDNLLPKGLVPPVWILSACNTSVIGAMRGCFVRALLSRGAICVVASLSRVDAFTASLFVGRLLTDIFSPVLPDAYDNFQEVFFVTQCTTALLYDPLLPLFRLADKKTEVRKRLGLVMSDFFAWTRGRPLDIRTYRYEIALFLGEAVLRHGLQPYQLAHLSSGIGKPETLLFSVFGVPTHVRVKK